MSFNNGDVLGPKIGGVKLLATPAASGKLVAALAKTDEVVFVSDTSVVHSVPAAPGRWPATGMIWRPAKEGRERRTEARKSAVRLMRPQTSKGSADPVQGAGAPITQR
jgi:hypothetical protein